MVLQSPEQVFSNSPSLCRSEVVLGHGDRESLEFNTVVQKQPLQNPLEFRGLGIQGLGSKEQS